MGTTLGSIPAVDKWQKVTVLFKTNTNGVTKAIATVGDTETDLGKITGQDLGEIKLKVGDCGGGTDRYVALKDIAVSQIDVDVYKRQTLQCRVRHKKQANFIRLQK